MTQAGQQDVNCGRGALFPVTLERSSEASSRMVMSAAKSVSSTMSAPRARRRATIFPSEKVPGAAPKPSPRATRTEGEVETMTIFSGSWMAVFSRETSFFSVMESTGHTFAHWPQWMQTGTSPVFARS